MNDLSWSGELVDRLEGRLLPDERTPPGCRLPTRARDLVEPAVWELAQESAGLHLRFVSDAAQIRVRWHCAPSPRTVPVPPHETCLSVAGLDCYARERGGEWRWVGAPWPEGEAGGERELARTALDPGAREYLLIAPAFRPLVGLELAVAADARLELLPPDRRAPIVCFGTSIVHGHSASRPGLCHAALLRRRLDRPVVNLGFAASARMQREIAQLIGASPAALIVVDCLPNMHPELVPERLPLFVAELRRQQPRTPVLFVGDRLFGDAAFASTRHRKRAALCAAQREALQPLQASDPHLHLLEHPDPFGPDGSDDGSHPNDLGYQRVADILMHAIAPLLADGPARGAPGNGAAAAAKR